MRSMPTSTTTGALQTGAGNSPCGCQEQAPPQPCCCNLVCFDRPNYFCGHLLTDSDLTLQQKYVVEKNKMYHRTMDGYGIVCGLKLTCDCDCKGHILVHDGFAIDDCGNDLVVCETTRFDVIRALKCKGLLLSDPPEDDCEPHRRKSHCEIKQCFYITICYNETESEFETPFQSSCTSGPKQCMPTRTHEGVRFDVTDTLPPRHSYLDDLERRFKDCFEASCNSQLGSFMKEHLAQLQWIVRGGEGDRQKEWVEPCELFCMLRAYFQNHLRANPDQFNCNLYEEVSRLACPRECDDEDHNQRDRNRKDQAAWEKAYWDELGETFGTLLYYIQRYQYDCVLGDLIFSCQQPCEAHCLVLGTVEVLNGKLIRVCNTPRNYLLAPANLLQVLIYDILTKQFATGRDCEDKKVPCCPDYKFDAALSLAEFDVTPCGRYEAATSVIEACRVVSRSLHESFEFTDSTKFSPKVLARLLEKPEDRWREFLGVAGIGASLNPEVAAQGLKPPNTLQAFLANTLLRSGDSVVGYRSQEGETTTILPNFVNDISPDRSVGKAIETVLEQSDKQARQMAELKAEIESLKKKLDGVDDLKKTKKGGAQQKEAE